MLSHLTADLELQLSAYYSGYDQATGALYGADGNGAGAAIQFAVLSAGLSLSNADFVVI